MTTVQLCITVRPCVKEFVKREAKKRQLSVSRYIESKIYNDEENHVYPIEELNTVSEQLDREIASGKAKSYDNVDEMINDLNL